jgi:hypothetical protein
MKKEYCLKQIDITEDTIKELELNLGDIEKLIDDTKGQIEVVSEEIKVLEEGITELDKSVAVATFNRKKEHEENKATVAGNNAVVQILEFAKNRLNKFYNPKLYKAPPKRELSEEERITLNMGGTLAPTEAPGGIAGTGISAVQMGDSSEAEDETISELEAKMNAKEAPPPPPATPGPYKKKGEESGGVIAMIDMMKADVEKETQEIEFAEKDGQEEYEEMCKDASDKRAADSKSLAEKTGVKAELEAQLGKATDDKMATGKELMGTKEYLQEVHNDCDWLLEKYDIRKEAFWDYP